MKAILISLVIVFIFRAATIAETIETKGACSPVLVNSNVGASIRISCSNYPSVERELDMIRKDNQLSNAETERLVSAVNVLLSGLTKQNRQVVASTSAIQLRVRHIDQVLNDLDKKPSTLSENNVSITSSNQSGGFTGTVVGTVNVEVSSPNLPSPMLLSDIPHPSRTVEAGFLLNYLRQVVDATQVRHVRLQAIFTRLYDGMPNGAVDWIEALSELQRLGRVYNVSMINAPWTYNGVGVIERFPLDYAFDIGDVHSPLPAPSSLPK